MQAKLVFTLTCILLLAWHPAKADQEFRIPIAQTPATLDPLQLHDIDSTWIATQIFDGLFEFSSEGIKPSRLVKSWKVSQDRKLISFELSDTHFSDGAPLCSQDIQFTFNRISKSSRLERAFTSAITTFIIQDEKHFQLKLSHPITNIPQILVSPVFFILPSQHQREIEHSDFFLHPVGTGSYRITHSQQKFIELKSTEPSHKTLRFIVAPSFEAISQFDLVPRMPAYNTKSPLGYKNMWYNAPIVEWLVFNIQHSFWKTKEHRQAVEKILQKEKFIQQAFQDRRKSWRPASNLMPNGIAQTSSRLDQKQLSTDSLSEELKTYLHQQDTFYFLSHQEVEIQNLKKAVTAGLSMENKNIDVISLSVGQLERLLEKNQVGFYFGRFLADSMNPFDIFTMFSKKYPDHVLPKMNSVEEQELLHAYINETNNEQQKIYNNLEKHILEDARVIPIASSYTEKLFVRENCELKNFGSRGPWYYKFENMHCKY